MGSTSSLEAVSCRRHLGPVMMRSLLRGTSHHRQALVAGSETRSSDQVDLPSVIARAMARAALRRWPGPGGMLARGSRYLRTVDHAGATTRCSTRTDDLRPRQRATRKETSRFGVGRRRGQTRSRSRQVSSARTWPRTSWAPRGWSREARWCLRVITKTEANETAVSSSGRLGRGALRDPRIRQGSAESRPKPKAEALDRRRRDEGNVGRVETPGPSIMAPWSRGIAAASHVAGSCQGFAIPKARAGCSPREGTWGDDRSLLPSRGSGVPTPSPARGHAQAWRRTGRFATHRGYTQVLIVCRSLDRSVGRFPCDSWER